MKKLVVPTLILSLILTVIFSMSGCVVTWEDERRQIADIYTSKNSFYRFYTFKAEVRKVRDYWDRRFLEFDVDYNYFQKTYGDDHTYLDGTKRWEGAYSDFNEFEFRITPSSTYQLLCENGGYDLLQEGTEVIITANSYVPYTGWIYPILSLEIDGITYLDFETGLENFLNSLRNS